MTGPLLIIFGVILLAIVSTYEPKQEEVAQCKNVPTCLEQTDG